jgi:xanthine dehydrogenase accessory factor
MKNARAIFAFLIDAAARGERCALVTITEVTGRSSRATGTHMAVSESGAFKGSLSGGCVEASVVGEAKRVIEAGRAETIRLGEGSPYFDIRLPCGGGMDLLIGPDPDPAVIEEAHRLLAERRTVTLALGRDGSLALHDNAEGRPGWDGDTFLVRHAPDMRILIIGHGAETMAMAGLAKSYGAEVEVLSPDPDIVEDARTACSASATLLKTPSRVPELQSDRHSAIVMLFHDHDWETELLAQALEQPSFFVGAMGSRTTHAIRLDRLRDAGVPEEALERLVGPIGLIPATRDPETLALSALAQIAGRYRELTGETDS